MSEVVELVEHRPAAGQAAAALDLQGVAAMGLGPWRAGYSWPVADAEYDALSEAFWDLLLDVADDLSPDEQDLLLADIGLPAFLLQHLHIKAARSRLENTGQSTLSGTIVGPYLQPDWTVLGRASAVGLTSTPRLKSAVRATAKGWLLNTAVPPVARLAPMVGRAPVWALGSRTPLRAVYLAHHKLACRYVTADLFAGGSVDVSQSLKRAVEVYLDRAEALARQILQVTFDQAAGSAWLARFGHMQSLIANIGKLTKLPQRLLVTDIGISANRTIARAMRRRGTEVVGFHHGNDMGVQPSPTSDIVDLLPVDRFVVPSSACLKWRRDQYKAEKLAAYHRVEFEQVSSPTYRGWLEAGSGVLLPDVIRTVMIVGFPPNWIRYAYRAGHWGLTQLDVEIGLIETLRAAGLRVLYKAHPEWEADLKHLFSGFDCEFIGGRFEECWQQADAFVFPRTSSTSFGFALCTNRPIVLLDVNGQKWQEEAYRLIAQRCRMVPAEIDSSLRIRFDPEALIAAVKERINAPDQGYVQEAMCG